MSLRITARFAAATGWLFVTVLAVICWHLGIANWELRGWRFNPPLVLAPVLALAASWIAWRNRTRPPTAAATAHPRATRFPAVTETLVLPVAATAIAWWWWNSVTSPLLRPAGVCIALAGSGWWIIELSGLGIRRRFALRLGAACAGSFLALAVVVANGIDGDGRGLVQWRWPGRPPQEWTNGKASHRSPPEGQSTLTGIQDFPGYRGVDRDGVAEDSVMLWDWQHRPPRQLWSRSLGDGCSSFVVSGGLAVTQEQDQQGQWICCLDVASGATVWRLRHDNAFESAGGAGPRATPTIAEGRVYAMGSAGTLSCADLKQGTLIWSVQVLQQLRSENCPHGMTASPLVHRDSVLVTGGTEAQLAAFDRQTGALRWRSGQGPSSYASPQAAMIGGLEQIVAFGAEEVTAHDPATGAVLWGFPWVNRVRTNCAQPLIWDDGRVLLATGYDQGAVMLKVDYDSSAGWTVKPLWTSRRLQAKFASPLLCGPELIVGLDNGILTALEVESGDRRWKAGRYGHGQLLRVGSHVLVQSEAGPVAILDIGLEGPRELGRLAPWSQRTWNHPCPAGRVLLLRSHRLAACYDLAPADAPSMQ